MSLECVWIGVLQDPRSRGYLWFAGKLHDSGTTAHQFLRGTQGRSNDSYLICLRFFHLNLGEIWANFITT